jgi:hypothetical protein
MPDLKTKHKTKAKDSFKTKWNLFLFECALNRKTKFTELDFEDFKIQDELVHIYSAKYYQYLNEDVVKDNLTVEKVYEGINSLEKNHIDLKIKLENQYVKNFEDVFSLHDFERFVNGRDSVPRCAYCNINESIINELANKEKIFKKSQRGYSFEIDRKNSNKEYSKENCVLSCYWCNNAKTDEFTYEEFKEIGKSIEKIWKNRLK